VQPLQFGSAYAAFSLFVSGFRRIDGRIGRRCHARIPGAFVAMERGNHDVEVAVAQHFGRRIGLSVSGDFADESVHHLETDFFVRLLAPFEPEFEANF